MKPIIIFSVLLLFGCKKTDNPQLIAVKPENPFVTLETLNTTNIAGTTVQSGGKIYSDGGSKVTTRGVCYSTSPNPTIYNNRTIDGNGIGVFSSSITGLIPNTTYFIRAFASNSYVTSYGNELSFTIPVRIGDSYQGGIVAYILKEGDIGYDASVQHGLIAADLSYDGGSQGLQWSSQIIFTGGNLTKIGTGLDNTNKIATKLGVGNYAVKYCYDLILNGYNDWYLPSIDELSILYSNRLAINPLNRTYSTTYWSSTEHNQLNLYAWAVYFNNGSLSGTSKELLKSTSANVQVIRSF